MSDPRNELPPLLRIRHVMQLLDVGRSSAYQMIKDGLVPSVRVGRNVYVQRDRLLTQLGLLVEEPASEGEGHR